MGGFRKSYSHPRESGASRRHDDGATALQWRVGPVAAVSADAVGAVATVATVATVGTVGTGAAGACGQAGADEHWQ